MPPTPDVGRDLSRQVATGDVTGYSLTIEAAAEFYARAGHPRTFRTIQRYCATGHLDSIKVATALGDKYFIDPQSLTRHIAEIEEMSHLAVAANRDLSRPVATDVVIETMGDGARHTATNDDMSPPVAPQPPIENSESDARHTATTPTNVSPPVARESENVSRLVAGLEREVERMLDDRTFLRNQIATKDKQIEALLERDRETNILVRGLQQMLGPLLSPARREHDERQDHRDVM